MDTLLKIVPLAILLVGAAIIVWRGLRRRADDSHNRARGGGPTGYGSGGTH